MRMKANVVEKPGNFQMDDWQIEKALDLSCEEFSELKTVPYQPQPFIAENKDCMFSRDGILIDAEGYNYARVASYVPGARDIVNAELDRAVERIVREVAEHTSDGEWRLPQSFSRTFPKDAGPLYSKMPSASLSSPTRARTCTPCSTTASDCPSKRSET